MSGIHGLNRARRAVLKARDDVSRWGVGPNLDLLVASRQFRAARYSAASHRYSRLARTYGIPEAAKMAAWIDFKFDRFEAGWPPYFGQSVEGSQHGGKRRATDVMKNPTPELLASGLRPWNGDSQANERFLVWLDFAASLGGEVLSLSLLPEFIRRFAIDPVLAVDQRMVTFAQRCFPGMTVVPKTPDVVEVANLAEQFVLGRELLKYVVSSASDFDAVSSTPIAAPLRDESAIDYGALGISWKTTNKKQGRYRNIPFSRFVDSIRGWNRGPVVVLQHGVTRSEQGALRRTFGDRLVMASPGSTVAEFASHIATVGTVATVDNSVLHFSGALGVPTLALLSRPAYWAWPAGGPSSRWYRSVRLVHQIQPRDWRGPLQELRQLVQTGASSMSTVTRGVGRAG